METLKPVGIALPATIFYRVRMTGAHRSRLLGSHRDHLKAILDNRIQYHPFLMYYNPTGSDPAPELTR